MSQGMRCLDKVKLTNFLRRGAHTGGLVLAVGMWLVAMTSSAAACRLALLLALDVSSSIDEGEYVLQRDGLAAALLAPEVAQAFLASPEPVALAVYEWSGQWNQRVVADWRLVDSLADLVTTAEEIAGLKRGDSLHPTSLGNALGFGALQMERAPPCLRQTIDVSGDGRNNDGYPPKAAYRHFPFAGITVNALAIGGAEELNGLVDYFHDEIIRGPGAFVEVADDHWDFGRAMRRKLERELASLAIGQLSP